MLRQALAPRLSSAKAVPLCRVGATRPPSNRSQVGLPVTFAGAWTMSALALSVLCVLAACEGPGSKAQRSYTVNATVVEVSGKAEACPGIPLTAQPTSCGGVALENVDARSIPGAVVFSNGAVQTPLVRLVGIWQADRLTLSDIPVVIKDPSSMTDLPRCKDANQTTPSQTVLDLQKTILDDRDYLVSHGVPALKTEPCGDNLLIVVPVADPESVALLKNRYGTVTVMGWLQPV